MNPIIAETHFSLKDYQGLTLFLTYRRPAVIAISLMGIFLLFSSLLLFILSDEKINSIILQLTLGCTFVILYPLYIIYSARRNYKTHGKIQERIVYEFTNEKIRMVGESFKSEMNWMKVYKVHEVNDWIIIYQSKSMANFLPKSSLGENINAFRNLVVSKSHIKSKMKIK